MLKLNLQLFADNIAESNGYFANYFNNGTIDAGDAATTANVGASYTGTSGTALANLTAEMKEFYSQYLIKDVGPNLVHGQFLESEKLPRNHGRTIEWRKWTNFSKKTTALTEGVTPEPSKISANPIRAELNQYGDWSLLTDLVQLQTIDNTLVEFTEKHSENAKLTLDTITREAMIAGAPKFAYSGKAEAIYETSAAITPADVARMTAYLRQNNAPTFDGSYVMIIHPYIAYDLMTNDKWIDVVKYSDSTKIFNGELGKLYGIRFVESTEAKVTKPTIIAHGSGAGTDGLAGVKVTGYSVDGTSHDGTITVATNTFSTTATTGDSTVLVSEAFYGTDPSLGGHGGLYVRHFNSDGSYTTIPLTRGDLTINASSIVIDDASAPAASGIAAGDIIYAGDTPGGREYYTCLVLGKGCGRKVDIDGNTAEIIVKPVGSAGATDALNQRGSVGWKVNAYAAKITNDNYIYQYICCSALDGAKAND